MNKYLHSFLDTSKGFTNVEYSYFDIQHDFETGLQSLLIDQFQVPRATAFAIARCLSELMLDDSRHYHTPVHILNMLAFAEYHKIPLSPYEELAIWFHDAICDPKQDDNEIRSAHFLVALLRPYLHAESLEECCLFITSTAFHLEKDVYNIPGETSNKIDKILDLDLCSFSFPNKLYNQIGDLIGLEYPHLDHKTFKANRNKFVQALLKKGSLYRTQFFKDNFEAQAQANIKADNE